MSVRAWKLLTPPDELPGRFSSLAADVAETVEANPALEDGLFRCTMAYATRGKPGASLESSPPVAYQAPLSLLIGLAERFMVGRGYAQLAPMDPTFPSILSLRVTVAESEPLRMLQTDVLSGTYVLASATELDQVDPALALQGCCCPWFAPSSFTVR